MDLIPTSWAPGSIMPQLGYILWQFKYYLLSYESSSTFLYQTCENWFSFVCDRVLQQSLAIQFVSSTHLLTDVMTKPLPPQWFLSLHSKLLVLSRPWACGGMLENSCTTCAFCYNHLSNLRKWVETSFVIGEMWQLLYV